MFLQLSGTGSGASKFPGRAKAAPTDSSAPLIRCHYSWPLTLSHKDYYGFELSAFPLVMHVCMSVWDRESMCMWAWHGVHMAYHIRTMEKAWEPPFPTRPSHCQHQLWWVFVSMSACMCMLWVFLSPRVVIFTQPCCVKAQIINYSSPRERDPTYESVLLPVARGAQGGSARPTVCLKL